jgi:hypothetical protein
MREGLCAMAQCAGCDALGGQKVQKSRENRAKSRFLLRGNGASRQGQVSYERRNRLKNRGIALIREKGFSSVK